MLVVIAVRPLISPSMLARHEVQATGMFFKPHESFADTSSSQLAARMAAACWKVLALSNSILQTGVFGVAGMACAVTVHMERRRRTLQTWTISHWDAELESWSKGPDQLVVYRACMGLPFFFFLGQHEPVANPLRPKGAKLTALLSTKSLFWQARLALRCQQP